MEPHYSNVLQGNSSCSHSTRCYHTVIFNLFFRSYSAPPLPRLSFALLKPSVFLKVALTYLARTPFPCPLILCPPSNPIHRRWVTNLIGQQRGSGGETKREAKETLSSIKKHVTVSRGGGDGQSNTQSGRPVGVCVCVCVRAQEEEMQWEMPCLWLKPWVSVEAISHPEYTFVVNKLCHIAHFCECCCNFSQMEIFYWYWKYIWLVWLCWVSQWQHLLYFNKLLIQHLFILFNLNFFNMISIYQNYRPNHP